MIDRFDHRDAELSAADVARIEAEERCEDARDEAERERSERAKALSERVDNVREHIEYMVAYRDMSHYVRLRLMRVVTELKEISSDVEEL